MSALPLGHASFAAYPPPSTSIVGGGAVALDRMAALEGRLAFVEARLARYESEEASPRPSLGTPESYPPSTIVAWPANARTARDANGQQRRRDAQTSRRSRGARGSAPLRRRSPSASA